LWGMTASARLPSATEVSTVSVVGALIDAEAAELLRRRPLVLSVREAASLLGVSKDLVYELALRGELPTLRLGRRVVIPTKALLTLIGHAETGA